MQITQLVISVNSWELAQCYMQKASNLLLQKFFQNKIVFIATIGNPRACTKKSSCLIKGRVLLAQPCLHRAHLLLLYNVTELRYGDLADTWRRWTSCSEASNFVPCPQICSSNLQDPDLRHSSFAWACGFLQHSLQPRGFWLRKWKMLLAGHTEGEYSSWHCFLGVLKISIRTTKPSLSSRDHISTASRT